MRLKKVPDAKEDGPGIQWKEFKKLADKLLKRELTGHAARDEIQNLMEKSRKNNETSNLNSISECTPNNYLLSPLNVWESFK